MEKHRKILGVSIKWFYCVVAVCMIGIVISSLFDFQINEKMANVTKISSTFAAFGCYFYTVYTQRRECACIRE